jgi:hypothetical protein
MKNHALGLCLLLLPFFSACEKMADIGSPQPYSKDGLSFLYPGNWKITEEEVFEENTKFINMESPGDANVMICFYDFEDDETLMEFATELSRDMADGLEDEIPLTKVGKLNFSRITREGNSGPLEGLRNKINITFLGEKVPHVLEFFCLKKQGKTVFIVCQSAEEDLKKTEPAFRQIVGSFQLK